ncbi:MAG: STAS domain-containing protein [Actinomycetota bacterium]
MNLLEIERGAEPRTLTLAGELDASNAPSLADALAAQHEEQGDVHLDVSRLICLDSVGLGTLIAAAKRLDRGRLVLVSPTIPVSRVLELSGIVSALPNLVVEGNPGS